MLIKLPIFTPKPKIKRPVITPQVITANMLGNMITMTATANQRPFKV